MCHSWLVVLLLMVYTFARTSGGPSEEAVEAKRDACLQNCLKTYGMTGEQVSCKTVDCGIPSQPGFVFGTPIFDTELYKMTVKAEACALGYVGTPTDETLPCQDDGIWTPASGCLPVDCGFPSQTGYTFEILSSDTKYLSIVNVTCALGYHTQPEKSLLGCQANGEWEAASGCAKVDCGMPSQTGYKFGIPTPNTLYESNVIVERCALGYVVRPSSEPVTCRADGTWTPASGCSKAECGHWRFVFENDANDNLASMELLNYATNGADVRVAVKDSLFMSIKQFGIFGENGCGQAMLISTSDYDRFEVNATWKYSFLCMRSQWVVAYYYAGSYEFSHWNYSKHSMRWFIRDEGMRPLFHIHGKLGLLNGSAENVVEAVLYGHDVKISGNPPKAIDALSYNVNTTQAFGATVWTLDWKGHTLENYDGNFNYAGFVKDDANWRFELRTTDNTLASSTIWKVGKHVNIERLTENAGEAKWFSDPCWHRAYHHSETGAAISGTLADLISAVEAGQKLKMISDSVLLEADTVYITGETICAGFLGDVSRSAMNEFESDLERVWRLACTTGTVEIMKCDVGSDTVSSTTAETASIEWFVDIPRVWTKIVSVDASGSVISGSKSALAAEIRKGSEVRYKLNYDGFSVFRQADNLEIKGEEVAAMHLRSIIEDTASPTFMACTHWFHTILSTTGRFDRSRWRFGSHSSAGHDSINVAADWFTNESL